VKSEIVYYFICDLKYPLDYLCFFEHNRHIKFVKSKGIQGREEVVKRERYKGNDLYKLLEEVE